MELAQDLKAVHGLDAETELSNILSAEILAEINREVVRTIYKTAIVGAQTGVTTKGKFDLDTDSNGRWMVEKIKGLAFQIEREANAIAKLTRRGKGNIMICSSDVASALAMAGLLDYNSALQSQVNLTVDDTGNTFAGTMFGRIKVYIDPYSPVSSTNEFAVVGYKVQMLMTLVYSTAHMYHYKWSEQLILVPSSQKLDLRLVTVLCPTHLLMVQMQPHKVH